MSVPHQNKPWHSSNVANNDNESPTVRKMKRELDNLRERSAKMEALIVDMADKYMMQVDGKFAGELSTRVNMITGRV